MLPSTRYPYSDYNRRMFEDVAACCDGAPSEQYLNCRRCSRCGKMQILASDALGGQEAASEVQNPPQPVPRPSPPAYVSVPAKRPLPPPTTANGVQTPPEGWDSSQIMTGPYPQAQGPTAFASAQTDDTLSARTVQQENAALRQQVFVLSQSLVGLAGSWFNDISVRAATPSPSTNRTPTVAVPPAITPEAASRRILEYLHPCRPISDGIEDSFRTIYYTVGTGRVNPCRVCPPAPRMAPALTPEGARAPDVDTMAPGRALAAAFVPEALPQSSQDQNYSDGQTPQRMTSTLHWSAECPWVGGGAGWAAGESAPNCRAVADALAAVLGISSRRVDVFVDSSDPLREFFQLCLSVYDSEDPSALPATSCLKAFGRSLRAFNKQGALDEQSLTRKWEALNALIDLPRLKFLGLAKEIDALANPSLGTTLKNRKKQSSAALDATAAAGKRSSLVH